MHSINERIGRHPELRLGYYGEDFGRNVWVLNAITPVTIEYILPTLVNAGEDMDEIAHEISQLIVAREDATMRRMKLIDSARAKLTPDEIEACHL